MKNLKTIVKFYAYGCIASLITLGLIIIYGLLYDSFYSDVDLELLIKTPLLSGLPFGTLLFIASQVNKPIKTKNIYILFGLKVLAYYWLGFVASLLLLGFIELYIFVFNEPYEYATIENIIAFALLLAIPLGILVRFGKKEIEIYYLKLGSNEENQISN